MDAKKTLEKLRGEADRATMSFYFSRAIFKQFKEACNGVPPSRVLEELMKEFVKDSQSSKKKNKRDRASEV